MDTLSYSAFKANFARTLDKVNDELYSVKTPERFLRLRRERGVLTE